MSSWGMVGVYLWWLQKDIHHGSYHSRLSVFHDQEAVNISNNQASVALFSVLIKQEHQFATGSRRDGILGVREAACLPAMRFAHVEPGLPAYARPWGPGFGIKGLDYWVIDKIS